MSQKKKTDIALIVEKKLEFFKAVVQKTILHVQNMKKMGILGISEVNSCVDRLSEQSKKIKELEDMSLENHADSEVLINLLQNINNDMSCVFKVFGTYSFEDFLVVCFGNNCFKVTNGEKDVSRLDLLMKYFHPVSYKIVSKKMDEEQISETTTSLTCFDVVIKNYYVRVHGMKVYLYNSVLKKSLVVQGLVDNVVLEFLNNSYIVQKKRNILQQKPNEENFLKPSFENFVDSLSLKDYFLYDHAEVYGKYAGYLSQLAVINSKTIAQNVKEFIADDLYTKRMTLVHLLTDLENCENQYLAYLLYDLLSNDTNGVVDTEEQTVIFDNLPWKMKQNFRDAMKKTIQYTNELSSFDMNKIPLEQQICLLKAPDSVKEKAMVKLKEVKAKSEDSGSKARQYLDGLLKIPFSIYKKEPCLSLMDTIRNQYLTLVKKHNLNTTRKENVTSLEILKAIKEIEETHLLFSLEKLVQVILSGDKTVIVARIRQINSILKNNALAVDKKKKGELKDLVTEFLQRNPQLHMEIAGMFLSPTSHHQKNSSLMEEVFQLKTNLKRITENMIEVKAILDKSVYGHENPKRQLERIIGQWVHGKNEGYCLGVCGPPGVGKTSIIKEALSNCLKDENGNKRPFHMIQLGGDSNGSSLIGHSYTYVGSTWGSIVQILIDSKCMNPIIFIDEIDKVSKTEHGKEIIGILTHLLDPSQNDVFQDKYFAGIELDLSKALFVLSYNDETLIDRILLDRIHRIKFDGLSLEEKLVIATKHVLPEIFSKMGLVGVIEFPKQVLKFIINEYTCEAGVRKMTQVLTEIVGEINLCVLKNTQVDFSLPIVITEEDIKKKYFKDKVVPIKYKIHSEPKVGVINALWANQMKQGGVLPLQISFIPSSKFLDLTLTGSLGDVMKESITVSLTNAWNLTSVTRQKYLIEKYNNPKDQRVFGLHIHCPSISTPKDGPSATTAFTVAIYSLLNERKIKNYFGITGETSFDFVLTQIGGLEEKIIHSIPAGVKEFIFPRENQSDFDRILEKYKGNEILDGIKFHCLEKIEDVLNLILED